MKDVKHWSYKVLWRDIHPEREPNVYEFIRVVLGKNSATVKSQ